MFQPGDKVYSSEHREYGIVKKHDSEKARCLVRFFGTIRYVKDEFLRKEDLMHLTAEKQARYFSGFAAGQRKAKQAFVNA